MLFHKIITFDRDFFQTAKFLSNFVPVVVILWKNSTWEGISEQKILVAQWSSNVLHSISLLPIGTI